MSSEGDAIYSRRVAELSKSVSLKLYASASFVFSEFAFLIHVTYVYVRAYAYVYTYIYVSKPLFRSASLRVWTEVKKRQKTKRPFPVTDRLDTTEIGCSCPGRCTC